MFVSRPNYSPYVCGCYYYTEISTQFIHQQQHYLPLVDTEVHSTILSTTSRTVLKQKFTNPSQTDLIKECIYTFPLYDGVSVVDFKCKIGDKVLRGVVREKEKAKEIFDQAVAKGETAGLLVQAPEAADVFSTKLGNIPAGETVIVDITYIGELKHHETEGIRFTIPTKIAPRYGSGPTTGAFSGQAQENGGIKITVDINMPEGSFIKGVQSPSHPISVSLGTVSTATAADPAMSKASATLALGSAALEKDFVLIVQSKDVGIPKAILETHPTIPHHRALMATLVPRFSLPFSRPEIVFVADRSGSMAGNIPMLISAMKVFLKSMPAGVKFNICSFGSSHKFLWAKSITYDAASLQFATRVIESFDAGMGGTETFHAIKATIERRFTDLPLEIIVLTDGDIWDQNNLFNYVNEQVEQTKGNIRIFPLGIGNGVSSSLIEGLARAGNGFSQSVQDGERLDNSVVRMLRGALSPHITDYTLEVKYEKEDDDFEFIEKVTEGMKVLLSNSENEKPKSSPQAAPKATISLFDTNYSNEKDAKDLKNLKDTKFSLPEIPTPKLLQAPYRIPSLFAFARTTVYLLMSPETIQRNPTTVVLRGTSTHGPLALEIPIEVLSTPGKTIHQLAAKKAVQDLEEGRGWIFDAKDQKGTLVKDRYPSLFTDLVQKEGVRLGEKFQVASKWCSFVAVEANKKEIHKEALAHKKPVTDTRSDAGSDISYGISLANRRRAEKPGAERDEDWDSSDGDQEFGLYDGVAPVQERVKQAPFIPRGTFAYRKAPATGGALFGKDGMNAPPPAPGGNPFGTSTSPAPGGNLFGTSTSPAPGGNPFGTSTSPAFGFGSVPQNIGGSLFGGSRSRTPKAVFASASPGFGFGSAAQTIVGSLFGGGGAKSTSPAFGNSPPASTNPFGVPTPSTTGTSLFGSAAARPPSSSRTASSSTGGSISAGQFGGFGAASPPPPPVVPIASVPQSIIDKVHLLIELQSFDGYWSSTNPVVAQIIGVDQEILKEKKGVDERVWTTLLVLKWLELKASEEEGVWGMVGEKGREWVGGQGGLGLEEEAGKVVGF